MRKLIKPLGIAGIMAATSLTAQAESQTFQASVQVLDPITITEATPMSFGKITASNAGGSNTFSTAGGPPTGPGNGSYLSGASVATINIDGTDGETIDYSLAGGACTDAVNLSFSPDDVLASAAADISFDVGGTLTVEQDTPAGNYDCDYTITANYQ